MLAATPAPACTRTSFFAARFLTVSGVAATPVWLGRVSAATPMLMDCGLPRSADPETLLALPAAARHPGETPPAELEGALHEERQDRGRDGACEQGDMVVQRPAGGDALAVAAG